MKLPMNIETEVLLDVSAAISNRTGQSQSGYMKLVEVCFKHGLNRFQAEEVLNRMEADLTDMIVDRIEENQDNR